MACEITLDEPIGILQPSGQLFAVRTSGTANRGSKVSITVECLSKLTSFAIADENSGRWTRDFTGGPGDSVLDCACGRRIRVTAVSLDNPSCAPVIYDGILKCPQNPCPEVTNIGVYLEDCVGMGRSVKATFTAQLSPPTLGCKFWWDFGDGSKSDRDGISETQTSHIYSTAGQYPVGLFVLCPNCSPSSRTRFVDIPACCPTLVGVRPTVEGCKATLVADTDPLGATGSFNWLFGDGSSPEITQAPTASHTYAGSGQYSTTVTFTPGGSECPSTSQTINIPVPDCGKRNGGSEDYGCAIARIIMIATAILAALALIFIRCVPAAAKVLLGFALGTALVSVIAGIIWSFCANRPCGWKLLFAWQVALGVGFGVLYFTGCCPWLWWVGIASILAAVYLIRKWVNQCHVGRCRLLSEMLVATSGILIPLLGWLGAIPALGSCINRVVAVGLTTMAAGLTYAVAACNRR